MNALGSDGFETALLALADDWIAPAPQDGPMQVFACGMAGARQGWVEAPYRCVPCTPAPFGRAEGSAARVRTRDGRLDVRIVPGVSQRSPHADVMRGEETQIAGILREIPDFDGVVCLPGTHTKWAHVSAGEIVSFRTVMTGELFALLGRQSVLRHSVGGDGWDEGAFLDAVSRTLSRPETLTSHLFELRAEDLLNGQDPATARSILSGLLVGAELGATKPWWMGRDIVVTGAQETMRVYASALGAQGLAPRLMPADDMTLAGLTAAREAAIRDIAEDRT